MSLFQANEWWKCSRTVAEEECGAGCLCVANIDNADDGADKVILGSYKGILYIYSPRNGPSGPDDCLLESDLQNPILQVKAGLFMPVTRDIHLAVLHPRLVSVYKFTRNAGEQENGLKMQKIYQHKLERSAFNMIGGPFGGVKDRDFICVQSLDGTLSIFEQETFAFTRFLPGFLLPGPLVYTAHTDSFITASSAYMMESYSYQVLAVASDAQSQEDPNAKQTGKKIETDWSFNVGELVLEIQIVNFPEDKPLLIALGEHSLFCFDTTGKLEFVKKFEDPITCIKSYPSSEGWKPTIVACTQSRQLLIFDKDLLKWAAKLEVEPIAVELGTFGKCSGMLVFTNDVCDVSCHFLGTSPTLFSLPRSKQRETALEKVDQQLEETKQLIANHLSSSGDELQQSDSIQDLTLTIQIPKSLDRNTAGGGLSALPTLTIQIVVKITRRVSDVQILVPVSHPISSSVTSHTVASLFEIDRPFVLHCTFSLTDISLPASLDQKVVVYYKPAIGSAKTVTSHFRLPFSLIASASAPSKSMKHKLTLETSLPCFNFMDLFPDLVGEHNSPNAFGLSYVNGNKVTIISSKSANRYRVQADEYDCLWLITDDLIHRLRQRDKHIHIANQDPPNLEEYITFIDEHYKMRKNIEEMKKLLEQRSQQFRTIQKHLLTRFKDKTPRPLQGLDTLLIGTHTQILALIDAIEENDTLFRQCSVKLSSATQLTIVLTSLWRGLKDDDVNLLNGALAVTMTYNQANSVGWEEMVSSSLVALIKTTLARNESNMNMSIASQTMELPQDTSKLKKHIAMLVDRLGKGFKLDSKERQPSLTVEKQVSLHGLQETEESFPASEVVSSAGKRDTSARQSYDDGM